MIRVPPAATLLLLGACGTPAAPLAPVQPAAPPRAEEPAPVPAADAGIPRAANVGPHGEEAARQRRGGLRTRPRGQEQLLAAPPPPPPPADPSAIAILPSALLYLDDGTLIVGVADGTVSAFDGEGRRRWSLGLRGAVRSLGPA